MLSTRCEPTRCCYGYQWFVRFTWIGAMLNGRRHPRRAKAPPAAPVTDTA